ncbi:MAG: glycoside hydrolase family 20 zincin-like fold domain-containing protein [Deinococcales bacterium]
MPQPILIPQPQKLNLLEGYHQLSPDKLILLQNSPQDLLFSAEMLQEALNHYALSDWGIASGRKLPPDRVGLSIELDSQRRPESYSLSIADDINISAADAAGVFYAIQTLIQLLRVYGDYLPKLSIEDYPSLERRGVMLDISRDKVPSLDTLYRLIDLFAHLKINELQLYTEHTFAYQQHETVWEKASPLTAEDILWLERYCHLNFIDLVPNQNTIGHMHRWLKHEAYRDMAETPDGFSVDWGDGVLHYKTPFSLNVSDARSFEFLDGLWDELLPNFSSQYVNIGCDETFDIGQGAAKGFVKRKVRDGFILRRAQSL